MSLLEKIGTALDVTKEKGIWGLSSKFRQFARRTADNRRARKWIAAHGVLDADASNAIRQQVSELPRLPLISVVMPVYDVDEIWLRKCINSVRGQIYQNWELCIADDCSPKPHIRTVLEEYSELDERIKVVFRDTNGHISAASNSALKLATGEFTVLLDHDDELSEDALFWVAKEISDHPEVQMIYSDEDLIDEKGRRSNPKFKPDFSRDLLYSLNMVTHLSAYKTDTLRQVNGFRIGLEGSQDYDLALRIIEQIDESQIRHIPRILYHWRAIPGSVALSGDEKPYAHERAREAIRAHFSRTGVAGEVEATQSNLHRVRYILPEKLPKVSLILAGEQRELTHQVEERWIDQTDYANIETTFLDITRNPAEQLNAACDGADGEVICFLDARLVPRSMEWLTDLVGFAIQPKIGAVTGKIVSNLDQVIGGGLVLGGARLSGVAHENYLADESGSLSRNIMIGNFSGVSASCLVVKRDAFHNLGGFDAVNLQSSLFDADLCLRLAKIGMRSVFNPFVVMTLPIKGRLVFDAVPTEDEKRFFSAKWKSEIADDRFSNPHYLKGDGRFILDI